KSIAKNALAESSIFLLVGTRSAINQSRLTLDLNGTWPSNSSTSKDASCKLSGFMGRPTSQGLVRSQTGCALRERRAVKSGFSQATALAKSDLFFVVLFITPRQHSSCRGAFLFPTKKAPCGGLFDKSTIGKSFNRTKRRSHPRSFQRRAG